MTIIMTIIIIVISIGITTIIIVVTIIIIIITASTAAIVLKVSNTIISISFGFFGSFRLKGFVELNLGCGLYAVLLGSQQLSS